MPSPRRRTSRGFTLIEMTVVVTILAMMAALIVPNLVAVRRGQQARELEAALLRLPTEARNEARRSGTAVTLRMEGETLVMERAPLTEDGIADPEADPESIRRVDLPEGVRLDAARQARENIDTASWSWVVYPDGSADAGGLEFAQGDGAENRRTLLLPAGPAEEARWQDGPLAEETEERWTAGELEARG